MTTYVDVAGIKVAKELYQFIQSHALPGSQVNEEQFWKNFSALNQELTPENKELLAFRDEVQKKINTWHQQNQESFKFEEYKSFLEEIDYLEPMAEDYQITTEGVDDEIALQAAPQLVVPLNNARFAINALNARWGNLYDALYRSDVFSEADGAEETGGYDSIRGEKVISFTKDFLDQSVPLQNTFHRNIVLYSVRNGELVATLKNKEETHLKDKAKFVGYQGDPKNPSAVLLKNNGLHIEIQIDRDHPIGKTDQAGIKGILMEAALTTIMDCEDSVAAVDVEDKVLVYRNWLGLMKGDLEATFQKGNQVITRGLNPDREYTGPDGVELKLRGRSLMFIRNVGHLMTSSAVLDQKGDEVQEGILDTVITSLIAKHTLLGNGMYQNTSKSSVYIVKPKMHGSREVAFANKLFSRVEDMLGLSRNTLKIGVMDEERRTSLNLKACIREVRDRVVFINTGFLDRTGDEIHTSMEAGPMIRKNDMQSSTWLSGYEQSNVNMGLSIGFRGHAQIGKGMWAKPDKMDDMLKQKGAQLQTGANTAWVPSPTAATLHALHYHQTDVARVQDKMNAVAKDFRYDILVFPIAQHQNWSAEEIQQELDNNVQSMLGYVVRWVEQGVGCSKVPDINNVGLMEDRATLRISSQHLANWLHHGICTKEQIMETLKKMAKVVDEQNEGDPAYRPMCKDFDASLGFQAACDLVFEGYHQPNGYTEPILHRRRLEVKNRLKKRNQ
jgi:malate synthase